MGLTDRSAASQLSRSCSRLFILILWASRIAPLLRSSRAPVPRLFFLILWASRIAPLLRSFRAPVNIRNPLECTSCIPLLPHVYNASYAHPAYCASAMQDAHNLLGPHVVVDLLQLHHDGAFLAEAFGVGSCCSCCRGKIHGLLKISVLHISCKEACHHRIP